MYKNLSIAVLLVAFGLVAARSTGTPASTSTSPTIVRKVVLADQTAPIPTTDLFTPGASGLFRVSVYMTQTVAGSGDNLWTNNLSWTDSAGAETTLPVLGVVSLSTVQTPPQAWGVSPAGGSPGNVVILEAIAGQPVTYSVTGGTGVQGSYSLYFVVERLI